MSIQCAACGNANVRASRQKDPTDAARVRKGQTPYRCRDCQTRFYAKPPSVPVAVRPAKKKRHRPRRHVLQAILKHHKRNMISASIFLLVLGVFFICLLYLVNYHPNTDSRLMLHIALLQNV